jgi:hypothetical protein
MDFVMYTNLEGSKAFNLLLTQDMGIAFRPLEMSLKNSWRSSTWPN